MRPSIRLARVLIPALLGAAARGTAQAPTAADTSGALVAAVAVFGGARRPEPPPAPPTSEARPYRGADSVTRALAALRRSGRPRPGPAPPRPAGVRFGDVWHVAPGDALTARVAAALGRPTRPADPTALCPWGAPAGAAVGLATRATLRFVAPDSAVVRLERACPAAGRGAFSESDAVEVARRGRAWVAVGHSIIIS